MKSYFFVALAALFAISNGVFVPPRINQRKHSLGLKECANGPTIWCQNITTATSCHAINHCIQTVWVHKQLPPDSSSVCQICLDMVKKARDQLLSNETQEEIKEVFEGSCELLKIKEIVKECDKIADDFIPQLIDTLASEMNPQVVCSVAGLCNNARVHQLLEEAGEKISTDIAVSPNNNIASQCDNCKTVLNIVVNNFNSMSKDNLLQSFLSFCGNMGTFSDACSNIAITHFNDIYNYLKQNLNTEDVCLLSGSCYAQFHQHANVEITPMSKIGYVPVKGNEGDDLPCELCEQLVKHLRDILIANTTEAEFKMIIQGICKQTGSFADECLNLANEYYADAYQFLVNNLNSTAVCDEIGICKNGKKIRPLIAPMLPIETAVEITPATGKPQSNVKLSKDGVNVKVITPQPTDMEPVPLLPIELLVPPHNTLYNEQVCVFCEYFLNYVQKLITSPATETKIKEIIDKACSDLPSSVNATCREFVDTYEPAMVALLAQEIDPSQFCPLIRACPSEDVKDVEVFMQQSTNADSKCPLCLYAVTAIESEVKNQKTKAEIKAALEKACSRFPNKLKDECVDFVDTYTDEILEALAAEFKPQEVCVYLKMCTDNKKPMVDIDLQTFDQNPIIDIYVGGDIDTNMIPDNTVNGQSVFKTSIQSDSKCVICEFVMKQIQEELNNQKTDADIKKIVHNICSILPKSVKSQCNGFVDEYADAVIALLESALQPDEICAMMHLCNKSTVVQPIVDAKAEIFECAICELTITAMEKILSNPKVDHDIEHVLEKTCRGLPEHYRSKCTLVIELYGAKIFDMVVSHTAKKVICQKILLCSEETNTDSHELLGSNVCLYGPSYWCESEDNADFCGARKHCETRVWAKENQTNDEPGLLGRNRCTYGPSYWCESEDNANECGGGARRHCELKVWNTQKPLETGHLVGSNPCTFGPSYWCQSPEKAAECGNGAKTHCETKVWNQKIVKREVKKVGTNECTYGPSYWCEKRENAEKCGQGAVAHCENKVWSKKLVKREVKKVGENQCTWGPGYWCESRENAQKCGSGAVSHCETKVWSKKVKRQVKKVGADECTRGPGYWCESRKNAEKCGSGAVSHCEKKVWSKKLVKREVKKVGADECTRGPGYWCESRQNAEKCGSGAVSHCEKKVWSKKLVKREVQKVGANECTRGPGYWCVSRQNAEKCGAGATKHCETKVWNK